MKFPRPNPDAAVEACAADWLARRDGGLSAPEAAAFARWRANDPRHEAAVRRLEATWQLLQQLGHYRPAALSHPDRDLLAPPRVRWFSPSFLAVAATLALAALGVWAWQTRTPHTPASASQVYATTPGGYQRLTLPDGSVVELNADTEVRVHFTARARRVELARGQAHFIVAKNKERPFWVETNSVAVRAVGTAFDVRVGAADVQVLVTAGTVELARARANATRPLLHAGWRAVIATADASVPVVEPVTAMAMRDAVAWHGTRLTFIETPLAEVVEQFNRRNDVQLALGDAELATMPVGGSFSADNLETFVRLLSSNGDIVVERPEPGRIVLRKAR